MSKFLEYVVPAFGGAAGVLGLAYMTADQFIADMPQVAPRLVTEAQAQAEAPAPVVAAQATTEAGGREGGFGLGRPATPEEIAAWNLDILADGTGLPVGSGDVATGDELFQDNCAACHGVFAEGVDNWPKLAGGEGTLADDNPVKTIGSYWPHLSTAYDYVRRSMPFGNAQSLTDDDVYAIVAYILYSNDLVDDEFVLSNENFTEVVLPNAGGFIVDDRPETEYPVWRAEPCMENCKESVEITMRATVLDVTPDDPTDDAPAAPVEMAATTQSAPEAEAEPEAEVAAAGDALDPELVAAGEKAFRQCSTCHMVGADAKSRTGPQLNEVFGRTAGTLDGFRYSPAMVEAGAAGLVWTEETMAEFLADPAGYVARTKMSFRGLRDPAEAAAISAYLKSAGG